jgi:hypothetical protein
MIRCAHQPLRCYHSAIMNWMFLTLLLVLLQRVIVYPNYMNSKKTVAEGRRIPANLGEFFLCASSMSITPLVRMISEFNATDHTPIIFVCHACSV